MHTISKKIIGFLGENSHINIERRDYCIYALEKKLYKALCLVLVLMLGLCVQTPIESLIVFASINFIRTKISGWHLQSPVLCVLLTISLCVGGGFCAVYLTDVFSSLTLLLIIINICLCLFFKPVSDAHLHLTQEELKKNTKLGIYRIALITILSAFIYFCTTLISWSNSIQLGLVISLMSTFIT